MGSINRTNLKKTLYYLKRNGLKNTWYAVRERLEEHHQPPYSYIPASHEALHAQRQWADRLEDPITFSIVVPAYHTNETYLRELMESVLMQSYPHWQLVIADASQDDGVESVIGDYKDTRICYVRLPENKGIAENTNRALAYVTGEYAGLLDHDDVITADALYEMALRIVDGKRKGTEIKILYSDEDKCDSGRTRYYEPNRKEKFNLDLLLSNNYICHFLVLESTLMKELGFRPEYDGAQDYDLVLRAAERFLEQEERIVHIPKVLYHWRCHTASTAENPQSKQYAYEAGRQAVQDFADRQEWAARAAALKHLGFYTLQYVSDPLENRKDLGAVGGRILRKGRIVGGRMTDKGILFYEGLPAAYSGYLHRAVLTQDADAVDIRCIRVRKECWDIFRRITGVPYKETGAASVFDASSLPEGTDYRKVSLELCRAIREAGYRILYLPSVTMKEDGGAPQGKVT